MQRIAKEEKSSQFSVEIFAQEVERRRGIFRECLLISKWKKIIISWELAFLLALEGNRKQGIRVRGRCFTLYCWIWCKPGLKSARVQKILRSVRKIFLRRALYWSAFQNSRDFKPCCKRNKLLLIVSAQFSAELSNSKWACCKHFFRT